MVGVGKSSILGKDVEKFGCAQKGWDRLMKIVICFQECFSTFYLL